MALLRFRYDNLPAACAGEFTRGRARFGLAQGAGSARSVMRCRTAGFGEWPRLSKVRRFEYLFPTAALGYFDGALLVMVLAAVMDLPTQVKLFK